MDLTLLIFLKVFLIAFINAGTPALCHMATLGQEDGLEGELSLKDYSSKGTSEPLKTSESTEPDASGDVEMSVSEDEVFDVKFPDGVLLTKDDDHVLEDSAGAAVLSKSSEESSEVNDEDDAEAFTRSDSSDSTDSLKSEEVSDENPAKNLSKMFFGEYSTDYADDYNKSVNEGTEMDSEKEYTAKTFAPPDSLLVLATPSGCSLLDFDDDDGNVNLVEFKFNLSNLEDCSKLTEDLVEEMKEHLAKELAMSRGPETKMVEISVRDPMRNRQLNIKETTEVFTSNERSRESSSSSARNFSSNGSDRQFDDFNKKYEGLDSNDKDSEDALNMLSDLIDVNFLPTSSDSVYVMSYSYRDQSPEEFKRDQLMNDFYSLLDSFADNKSSSSTSFSSSSTSSETDSVSETGSDSESVSENSKKTLKFSRDEENSSKSSESSENKKSKDGSSQNTYSKWFRSLQNLPTEKLEKFIEDAKKLLETEEGKKAVEKLGQELDRQFEKTKEFVKKEVSLGKQILEDLSKHGMENVECSKLTKEDCANYSKCEVMKVEDKDMCFVSPRTIYWLLETNCGLQTKPALMSIARDLQNVGYLSSKRVNNLAMSFDSDKICNAITHSYLSKLSPKVDQQPNNAFN